MPILEFLAINLWIWKLTKLFKVLKMQDQVHRVTFLDLLYCVCSQPDV